MTKPGTPRSTKQKRFGDIRKFTIAGMDDALVSKVNQAAVRKGNLMATTLNSSIGQFRPEELVKLTALALKVVTP